MWLYPIVCQGEEYESSDYGILLFTKSSNYAGRCSVILGVFYRNRTLIQVFGRDINIIAPYYCIILGFSRKKECEVLKGGINRFFRRKRASYIFFLSPSANVREVCNPYSV